MRAHFGSRYVVDRVRFLSPDCCLIFLSQGHALGLRVWAPTAPVATLRAEAARVVRVSEGHAVLRTHVEAAPLLHSPIPRLRYAHPLPVAPAWLDGLQLLARELRELGARGNQAAQPQHLRAALVPGVGRPLVDVRLLETLPGQLRNVSSGNVEPRLYVLALGFERGGQEVFHGGRKVSDLKLRIAIQPESGGRRRSGHAAVVVVVKQVSWHPRCNSSGLARRCVGERRTSEALVEIPASCSSNANAVASVIDVMCKEHRPQNKASSATHFFKKMHD
eukprot:CAMPEP_0178989940 /NCGR_PEP_ID=MMETSP0795-20121207/4655_1 /TAXON_ID=88552 /ORGANISM="Amoebophrya sp., Strain Ameob2" /LENGTH=276 /DNA_ID=CAMNT_0020681401 /DNA_START=169 /DNA_END=999 /DNA_ORIENTATION=+